MKASHHILQNAKVNMIADLERQLALSRAEFQSQIMEDLFLDEFLLGLFLLSTKRVVTDYV